MSALDQDRKKSCQKIGKNSAAGIKEHINMREINFLQG